MGPAVKRSSVSALRIQPQAPHHSVWGWVPADAPTASCSPPGGPCTHSSGRRGVPEHYLLPAAAASCPRGLGFADAISRDTVTPQLTTRPPAGTPASPRAPPQGTRKPAPLHLLLPHSPMRCRTQPPAGSEEQEADTARQRPGGDRPAAHDGKPPAQPPPPAQLPRVTFRQPCNLSP